MSEQQVTKLSCPECGKIKPEDPNNLHDTILMCWDWRKADRPNFEDPIPKSLMCHECFVRIREEYSPLAPWWDKDGIKRKPEERIKDNEDDTRTSCEDTRAYDRAIQRLSRSA